MSLQSSSTTSSASVLSQANRPQVSTLPTFFREHPVAATVALGVADVVLHVLFTLLFKAVLPGVDSEIPSLIALILVDIAFVSAFGLWGAIGLNAPSQWRNTWLLVLPAVLVFVLPFVLGVKTSEISSLALYTVIYLLVGLREETLWRGVDLHILRNTSALKAVLISGLVFGLTHAANLLVRSNPYLVLAQMLGATTFGIGFGAIRLRTNTIVPLILFHAASDLFLHYTNLPAIPLEVARDVILVFYGLYLIWGNRTSTSDQP